jgi:hypothetical protein
MGFLLSDLEEKYLCDYISLEEFNDARILVIGSTGMLGSFLPRACFIYLNFMP